MVSERRATNRYICGMQRHLLSSLSGQQLCNKERNKDSRLEAFDTKPDSFRLFSHVIFCHIDLIDSYSEPADQAELLHRSGM